MHAQILIPLILIASCGRINYDAISETEPTIDAASEDADRRISIIAISSGGLHSDGQLGHGNQSATGNARVTGLPGSL